MRADVQLSTQFLQVSERYEVEDRKYNLAREAAGSRNRGTCLGKVGRHWLPDPR